MFVPKRMCVACREMCPKEELVRLVKTENGIVIDAAKKLQGRGVYVHRKAECVRLAEKKKAFQRHFRCAVEREVYERAAEHCDG